MLLDSLAHGGNDRTLSCVTLPRDMFSVEDIPILQMSQMLELQWHCAVAKTSKEVCAGLLQIAPRTQIVGIGVRRSLRF